MTKTLTEQWREGTLPCGGYYIKLRDGSIKQTDYDNISKTFDTEYFRYNESVKEVLDPVPSYDEVKEMDDELKELATKNDTLTMENGRLKEQLEIATNALKKYMTFCRHPAEEALKEMKGVK